MTDPQTQASLSAAKAALRHEIIQRRDALDATTRAAACAVITDQILKLECFQRARCVLLYASMGSEFDTSALITQVMAEKKLALPKVDKATRMLQLYFVTNLEADLQPGVWDIREPRSDRCTPAPLNEIDLVLAPGVAFTQRGDRLGYGAGYYDRLLARFMPLTPRPAVIVAAFSVQMVSDLPLSATDRPVDCIVTETAIHTR